MATDFDQLIDALAQLSASERGLHAAARRAHVAELKTRVENIQRIVASPIDGDAARGDAAAEVDALVATLARLERTPARTLAKASPQIQAAYRHVDFAAINAGLRVFAEWLRAPTPESTAAVELMVVRLRNATPPAWEDAAAAKQLEAEIDATVDRSLEEIFGKS